MPERQEFTKRKWLSWRRA